LQRGEALLAINNVKSFYAEESDAGLRFKHNGTQEVRVRTVAGETSVSFVLNI